MTTPRGQTIVNIRLRLPPGAPGIHALRRLLKALLRRYGLKCIGLKEER
jgi:hypothetical protein